MIAQSPRANSLKSRDPVPKFKKCSSAYLETGSFSTFGAMKVRANPLPLCLNYWQGLIFHSGLVQDLPRKMSTQPPLRSDHCPEAFDLMNRWLRECSETHGDCETGFSGTPIDDETQLPTRVLDVGQANDERVSLLATHGMKGQYCALSYCWGPPGVQKIVTTNDNIAEHLDGIAFAALPKTFQDAVIVTRQLGMPYLWIDALCIIQGSDDWTVEAAKMADVYQNAALVIAAAGASDPTEGCFSARVRPLKKVQVPHYGNDGRVDGYFWLSCQDPGYPSPSRGPLGQRGWALQESYMARKLLSFMPSSMSWRCKKLECFERTNADTEMYGSTWALILWKYTERQLTYNSDRLMGLEGLAKAYLARSGKGSHEYVHGHMRSDFPEQLLWTMFEGEQGARDLDDVPSWSWASRPGVKFFPEPETGDKLTALIEDAEITVSNKGVLHLEGFVRGYAASFPSDTEELSRLASEHWTKYFDRDSLWRLGSASRGLNFGVGWADDGLPERVYMLYLVKAIAGCGTMWSYGGLLLERVPGQHCCFQRVGVGFTSLAPASYDDNGVTAVALEISIV